MPTVWEGLQRNYPFRRVMSTIHFFSVCSLCARCPLVEAGHLKKSKRHNLPYMCVVFSLCYTRCDQKGAPWKKECALYSQSGSRTIQVDVYQLKNQTMSRPGSEMRGRHNWRLHRATVVALCTGCSEYRQTQRALA